MNPQMLLPLGLSCIKWPEVVSCLRACSVSCSFWWFFTWLTIRCFSLLSAVLCYASLILFYFTLWISMWVYWHITYIDILYIIIYISSIYIYIYHISYIIYLCLYHVVWWCRCVYSGFQKTVSQLIFSVAVRSRDQLKLTSKPFVRFMSCSSDLGRFG